MIKRLGALSLVAALCGCTMCQAPFDYCAPVVPESGCPNCNFGARRGSVFNPMDGVPGTTALVPTPARGSASPAPTEAAPPEAIEPEPQTTELDSETFRR